MQAPIRSRRYKESPYERWQQSEGIPIHRGSYVEDLYSVALQPWTRTGQQGAFVNLADQQEDDGYVLEIAPGGQTSVLHHMFEAAVFVLEGAGATSFWQLGKEKQTLEWQRGSIFSPPLNCYYQHFNLEGNRPARLFAVTNAPMVINLFDNTEFVFGADHTFADRFGGEQNYFSAQGEFVEEQLWRTNFIPDIRRFELKERVGRRAVRDVHMVFALAKNLMALHCSEFAPGIYKKAHRHGVGAHVIVLDGQGYSLLWHEGSKPEKVNWKDGSVLSPREQEYHQHFNTGPSPARYLAMRLGALDSRHWHGAVPTHQIEYEEEDPAVYDQYVAECERNGAQVVLPRPAYRDL
jgi:gentisate 1,2-dioxygenase